MDGEVGGCAERKDVRMLAHELTGAPVKARHAPSLPDPDRNNPEGVTRSSRAVRVRKQSVLTEDVDKGLQSFNCDRRNARWRRVSVCATSGRRRQRSPRRSPPRSPAAPNKPPAECSTLQACIVQGLPDRQAAAGWWVAPRRADRVAARRRLPNSPGRLPTPQHKANVELTLAPELISLILVPRSVQRWGCI